MLVADRQEPNLVDLISPSYPPMTEFNSSYFSDSYHQITHQVVSRLAAFEGLNLAQKHLLIQGNQGSGKTSILKQIQHTLLTDEAIPQEYKHLSVIRFNEHEYGIRTIQGLCQCVSDHMEARAQVHSFALPPLHKSQIQASPSDHWSHLINWLKDTQTLLLILIDNIDCLLKQLDKDDYDFAVKNIFAAKQPHYRLIVSSTISHSSLDVFTPIQIPSLDKNQAHRFLQNKIEALPVTAQNQAILALNLNGNKLETVRLLTQANAKILAHFHQAFLQSPSATCYQYLAFILNQFQSQFCFHIERLSAQQQVIVHALGCHWQASQVANLTRSTHLPSKSISAQLTQLEKQNVIEKIPSTNKNHYYRLTDRRFQLWYLLSFANHKVQKEIMQTCHLMGYLTKAIPYANRDHGIDKQDSNLCRSRLESSRYGSALSLNHDIKTEELTHLFIHASDFVLSIKNKGNNDAIKGQDYCESASQYFKEQLPGERLTFLLNAACRGYEQAYLGLISLFDLADTPGQLALAYQINHALCLSAQRQGYDFSSRLLSLYLSQGVMQAECIKLAHEFYTIEEPEPVTLLLQSFTSIWSGQTDTGKHLLNTYLEKTDLNALEPMAFEWLVELLILLMSKQEWAYLTQIFNFHNKDKTLDNSLKGQSLVLYYGLLTLKPKLDDKELNDTLAMPPELKEAVHTLVDCVSRMGEKYC